MEDLPKEFMEGVCEGQKTIDGEQMPLVLEPAKGQHGGLGSLVSAIRADKEWFLETLIKNSAILIRGFDVRDAEGFNEIVEACGWDDIRYVGPAPRTHVYKSVWTANEGPLSEFIYYHHEMVLSTANGMDAVNCYGMSLVLNNDLNAHSVKIKEFPNQVILFCEVPPPEGGETPFVPSFRVTERMLKEFPENVKEMEEKGLRYTFRAVSKNDTNSMRGRGWEDTFGTSDKDEAERRAKALGMEVEWLPNGGVKTMLGPRPLTRVFPKRKGRRMWFNTVVGMYGKEISSAEMADGSEIPKNVVDRCEQIIEEESIQFRWEKGDILFLDNPALLHGRRPSLPPRRVLVATCK